MATHKTKTIITAALLAALTTVATMVIRIPTPTLGYIHLGDGMVLICGILLGRVSVRLPRASVPCWRICSAAIWHGCRERLRSRR